MKKSESVSDQDSILECLHHAIQLQKDYLKSYEQPSEPIAYETVRTLDDLFCRDLMEPARSVTKSDQMARVISTWGVNHALRRVVPMPPVGGSFRNFPSHVSIQEQADDFVFCCGALALAERLEGWIAEGMLAGELRSSPETFQQDRILILRIAAPSCYDEEIGRAGIRWACDHIWHEGHEVELALEERYLDLKPELDHRVHLFDNWLMTYSCSRQIDDHFFDWGKLYLRRIFSQDLLGHDDVFDGRPFSRFLDVLTAVSARSQKHIAYAAILRARHPSAHIRNLLTTFCPREEFIASLATYLDGDFGEVESIVSSLTLSSANLAAHTRGTDTAWAPILQASKDTLILPTYGVDINPFLFLLNDLRHRYESDWFRAANRRERRWIDELQGLFAGQRWRTHCRNLRLTDSGKDLTDIDFATYDVDTNELGLFQLKWQQPVGLDNRARRSAGKNLLLEGNRWVAIVTSWIERHGVIELIKRLGFQASSAPKVRMFVIGRYHVHFGGYDFRDDRAVWADWGHFRHVFINNAPQLSIEQLASKLTATLEQSRAEKLGESIVFPVGNLAVVLNPTWVPEVK